MKQRRIVMNTLRILELVINHSALSWNRTCVYGGGSVASPELLATSDGVPTSCESASPSPRLPPTADRRAVPSASNLRVFLPTSPLSPLPSLASAVLSWDLGFKVVARTSEVDMFVPLSFEISRICFLPPAPRDLERDAVDSGEMMYGVGRRSGAAFQGLAPTSAMGGITDASGL